MIIYSKVTTETKLIFRIKEGEVTASWGARSQRVERLAKHGLPVEKRNAPIAGVPSWVFYESNTAAQKTGGGCTVRQFGAHLRQYICRIVLCFYFDTGIRSKIWVYLNNCKHAYSRELKGGVGGYVCVCVCVCVCEGGGWGGGGGTPRDWGVVAGIEIQLFSHDSICKRLEWVVV